MMTAARSFTFIAIISLALTAQLPAATNSVPVKDDRASWEKKPKTVVEHVATHGLRTLDRVHGALSWGLGETVDTFDGFFGDERVSEENNGSLLRVSLPWTFMESREVDFSPSVNARVALPQLQNRLHLILDELTPADDGATPADDNEEDRRFSLGLRFIAKERLHIRFNYDAGVRFNSGLDPFLRARATRAFVLRKWVPRITEDLLWTEKENLKSIFMLNFDRPMVTTVLFRASSRLIWKEDEYGVTPSENLFLFWRPSDVRAASLNLGVTGATHPATVVDKYRAAVTYRQRVIRKWIFFEVTPEAQFPRERDFKFTPMITLKMEMIFGPDS